MPIFNGRGLSSKYWAEEDRERFVFEHKKSLILNLIYDWSRRYQSLLEIGCGTGEFLEVFWETGFDVTGIDPSPTNICGARSRLGSKSDFYIGQVDYLAFEDNQFDYVAMINILDLRTRPETVIHEAYRIARKGFIIGFLNRFFWYSFMGEMSKKWTRSLHSNDQIKAESWFGVKRILRRDIPGSVRFTAGSVLPWPQWSWIYYCWFQRMNKKFYSPYWGMFSAARVDLGEERPLTPLMAWNTEPKAIG